MRLAHKALPVALLSAALLQMPQAISGDTYYRWIDSSGVVQISDRPPTSGIPYDEGTMGVAGNFVREQGSSSGQPGTSTGRDEPVMAIGDNPGRAPEVVKDPVLCENARQNLEALDNFVRIRVQNPDGSYRILSPDEKDAQRATAKKTIELNCE